MNRKSLTKLWILVWTLFALSHALIPMAYFGCDESGDEPFVIMTREFSAIMAWGWFGILPVLGISCLSPIFTAVLWKELDTKARKDGLLLPGLIILATIASMCMCILGFVFEM